MNVLISLSSNTYIIPLVNCINSYAQKLSKMKEYCHIFFLAKSCCKILCDEILPFFSYKQIFHLLSFEFTKINLE